MNLNIYVGGGQRGQRGQQPPAGAAVGDSHFGSANRIIRMDLSAGPEALPALVAMRLAGAGSAY